jgi:t-SNARE complex subunit (syntaxin)
MKFLQPDILFWNLCEKALKFKLFELLKNLQKIQMDLKKDSKQKMKERIKMYNNSIDEEELEELVQDPDVSIKL